MSEGRCFGTFGTFRACVTGCNEIGDYDELWSFRGFAAI